MKNNNDIRSVEGREKARQLIAEQTAAFLAGGGKIVMHGVTRRG